MSFLGCDKNVLAAIFLRNMFISSNSISAMQMNQCSPTLRNILLKKLLWKVFFKFGHVTVFAK